jgi:hypothetical protein
MKTNVKTPPSDFLSQLYKKSDGHFEKTGVSVQALSSIIASMVSSVLSACGVRGAGSGRGAGGGEVGAEEWL